MTLPRYFSAFRLSLVCRFFFCAALCCAVFLFPALHGEAVPVKKTEKERLSLASSLAGSRFSAACPFISPVSEQDAAVIAEATARAKAMQRVVRVLATLPVVRVGNAPGPMSVKSPNLLALAHATAKPSVLLVSKSRKPPSVTITVTFPDDAGGLPMEIRARDALMHPGRLELYEKTALRGKTLLDAFDALTAPEPSRTLPKTSESAVKSIVNEIQALAILEDLLPSHDGLWKDPAAVREAMQAALALAPESALCRNALGDASLQLGRSQEAFEEQTRAIRADPSFARAFHSRGAASMALGLLSSAVADFSEAIRFSPRIASYYRSRGMARRLLGETQAMCRDLYQACILGECDEFQWSVSRDYCSAAQSPMK